MTLLTWLLAHEDETFMSSANRETAKNLPATQHQQARCRNERRFVAGRLFVAVFLFNLSPGGRRNDDFQRRWLCARTHRGSGVAQPMARREHP